MKEMMAVVTAVIMVGMGFWAIGFMGSFQYDFEGEATWPTENYTELQDDVGGQLVAINGDNVTFTYDFQYYKPEVYGLRGSNTSVSYQKYVAGGLCCHSICCWYIATQARDCHNPRGRGLTWRIKQ